MWSVSLFVRALPAAAAVPRVAPRHFSAFNQPSTLPKLSMSNGASIIFLTIGSIDSVTQRTEYSGSARHN